MSLRFAFKRPDGGVTIVGAAPKSQLERVLGEMTDEQYRSHVLKRSIPADAQDIIELPPEWAPDRTFRDAWTMNGRKVEVDMPRAREIHRDRIRQKRTILLRELDVEYQRADEIGDAAAKARVAARKQALRDAPADPRIEAAATPDELKVVDPIAEAR